VVSRRRWADLPEEGAGNEDEHQEERQEEEEEMEEEEEQEPDEQQEEGAAEEERVGPASEELLWRAHWCAKEGNWEELTGILQNPAHGAVIGQVPDQERPSGWGAYPGGWRPPPGWLLLNSLAFRNRAPAPVMSLAVRVAQRLGCLDQRNPARPDRADEDGQTPLHCAAAGGNATMAELLLEAGAGGGPGTSYPFIFISIGKGMLSKELS